MSHSFARGCRGLRRALLLASALAGACGSDAPPPPPASPPRASLIATPASADDLEVARVNGRPVWGSCVAGQLARAHDTAPTAADLRAALDECIGFELLAQTAESRGMANDPEANDAARTMLVSRMITTGFEDRYQRPEDLRERLDLWITANEGLLRRPELRACTYVRIEVKKDAAPDVDQRARQLAERVASELRTRTGLFGTDLSETARRLGQGSDLVIQSGDVPARPRVGHPLKMNGRMVLLEGLEPSFGTALFEIPEVGRISPAIRTPWGWDVIMLTAVLPEEVSTRDQLAAKRFDAERLEQFKVWTSQLKRELDKYELDTGPLDRFEAAR
ncbi:MAG: peptidylprolyl isomerase [Kofleriaceae bacterium]